MVIEKTKEVIAGSSFVEMSLVVSICIAIAGGAGWATHITVGQDMLRAELEEIRALLEVSHRDRWTGKDMRAWVHRVNREVEIWSQRIERALELPAGKIPRFEFTKPSEITGDRSR